ncbi:Pyridoxamine 5'-phosphate oxidase family protein [Thalictrum thalictroides]|uniref:Pyridoxamine 5'-phosphate oxidase family protein n=1 Tax=Thalictrum thalictroides TaxID=46969 RepID=A0A7J6X9V1_THATH|nr:Pyridoxamine 5'-phosphate oxidase family protein [Thalictrum thalictroides]
MHNISDIYFIGGFGTVAWVDVKEYEMVQPDKIAINGGEQNLKSSDLVLELIVQQFSTWNMQGGLRSIIG